MHSTNSVYRGRLHGRAPISGWQRSVCRSAYATSHSHFITLVYRPFGESHLSGVLSRRYPAPAPARLSVKKADLRSARQNKAEGHHLYCSMPLASTRRARLG